MSGHTDDSRPIPSADADNATPTIYSGIDIVSIRRIADLLEEFSDSFPGRAFTVAERRYCDRQRYPSQHYAARWAAKEAFLKVLGEPSPSVPTREIEVIRDPSGPRLSLGPSAREALSARLSQIGVDARQADRSVSLSHDREADAAMAQIVVIATGNNHPGGGCRP